MSDSLKVQMCPKSLHLWPLQQHFSNISVKGIQDALLEVLFSKINLKSLELHMLTRLMPSTAGQASHYGHSTQRDGWTATTETEAKV